MPIWHFEKCSALGLEQQALLNVPYRRALALLQLADRHDDPLCEMVADKIKEVHERGVRHAFGISDIAVRELTHHVDRARQRREASLSPRFPARSRVSLIQAASIRW